MINTNFERMAGIDSFMELCGAHKILMMHHSSCSSGGQNRDPQAYSFSEPHSE